VPAAPPRPKRMLFVCVGNSCRSQMAEALARHRAGDVIEPLSAGISPLGSVAEMTRRVLLERGVRTDGLFSKGLRDVDRDTADLIINMTGIPGGSLFPGANVEDWEIEDPYGEDLATYHRICDDIEEKILELAARFRAARAADQT